jgi:hypothetical protein
VIFGAITMLVGCCSALLLPLLILARTMAANSSNPPPTSPLVFPVVFYAFFAVALISLGIGSIQARRWARALLVIWSWSLLIIGLISIVVLAFMAPQLTAAIEAARPPGQPQLTGTARYVLMLIPIVTIGFIYVLLPLTWALFYSGRNVKATCEARDPVVRWTDRCPLPVLAVSLWLLFGALMMLLMPAFHAVAPFFGILLSGAAGIVLYLLLAFISGYSAWALYRLDRRGWLVVFALMVVLCVSNLITYSLHDLAEVYAAMGYSTAQIGQIRKLVVMNRTLLVWSSLVFTLPFLGYLLYIRKFLNDAPLAVVLKPEV